MTVSEEKKKTTRRRKSTRFDDDDDYAYDDKASSPFGTYVHSCMVMQEIIFVDDTFDDDDVS